jgi:hypothetical protein
VTCDHHADPILGELLARWARKRGGWTLPARRDVDPTELPKLLPHMRLIDVDEGGARFRCRLRGTEPATAVGHDDTGFADPLVAPWPSEPEECDVISSGGDRGR